MTDTTSRPDQSSDRFDQLIGTLGLGELERVFLRSRWLDQVEWLDRAAKKAQRFYYVFRLVAIVGGVIVPALVSLNLNEAGQSTVRWIAFVISLLVAISVALEEFFRFGERWRHYRRTAEMLKSEGWMFFQKAGPYKEYSTHADAYAAFAGQIETLARQEVELYITDVAREKKGAGENPPSRGVEERAQ